MKWIKHRIRGWLGIDDLQEMVMECANQSIAVTETVRGVVAWLKPYEGRLKDLSQIEDAYKNEMGRLWDRVRFAEEAIKSLNTRYPRSLDFRVSQLEESNKAHLDTGLHQEIELAALDDRIEKLEAIYDRYRMALRAEFESFGMDLVHEFVQSSANDYSESGGEE